MSGIYEESRAALDGSPAEWRGVDSACYPEVTYTESTMGGKPSNHLQSDRPESGGADKDMQHENSGLLEREKEKVAQEQGEKRGNAPEQHSEQHEPFSVGSPRNPTPKKS